MINAFTETEADMIAMSLVPADNNPSSNEVYSGNSTEDKVFLISIDEAKKYFRKIGAVCQPTKYAISNNIWTSDYGYTWWWLRTVGEFRNHASGVSALGVIDEEGHFFELEEKEG